MSGRQKCGVSVLLPVRDCARYFEAAVVSILRQTYTSFELLVLEDGSTDGSAVIAAKLACSDSRIRVVPTHGKGLVHALNVGLANASAGLIARMDADDMSMPDRLEHQVRYMQDHPTVAIVGGAAEIIDAQSRYVRTIRPPCEQAEIATALERQSLSFVHPSVVMRRSELESCGGYREEFPGAEDYDLWLRMVERYRVANLPAVVLRFRKHAGSVSRQRVAQQAVSGCLALAVANLRRRGQGDIVSSEPELFRAAARQAAAIIARERIPEGVVAREGARRALASALRPREWGRSLVDVMAVLSCGIDVRRRAVRASKEMTQWLEARLRLHPSRSDKAMAS